VAVLAAATALTACSTLAPIQNVENVPVSSSANKPLTPAEVRGAIVRAGAGLGWIMKDGGQGVINGTLILRTHTAEVQIPYSSTSYAIVYKSSINLQEAGGKIHRNYNGWVQNLNRGINAQLAAS
jgi:type IV pilus biogenesis protein CpaD/CtpE